MRGVLGPEESRRDERSEYCKEVEGCWDDVTLIQGRFVAGEVPGCIVTSAEKYAEGVKVADEEDDIIEVFLLPDGEWIVDLSATSSYAGLFW